MSGVGWTDAERGKIYAALWSAETHFWCADLTGCPHCQEQERKVLAVLGPMVEARVRAADKRGRRDEREQHDLANSGCVPAPAYRDLTVEHDRLAAIVARVQAPLPVAQDDEVIVNRADLEMVLNWDNAEAARHTTAQEYGVATGLLRAALDRAQGA